MWAGGPAWGVTVPAMKGKGGGGKAWGAKGKGGGAAWGRPAWGVPELQSSLAEALAPIADQEPEYDDIIKKIQQKVQKVSDKYKKDERLPHKGGASQAKLIVEEFVEHLMGGVSGCCYDAAGVLKPWFHQVDFKNPLLLIVLHTFESAKIFARTLKPQLIKYIEDGLFKYVEEDRIERAIKDVVELSGIGEGYKKKAIQHLNKSYDDAHMSAPFGGSTNASPELAVLQDFVKGWLIEFVGRAWDVMESGFTDGSRESQVSNVTVLFQNLLDPTVAVVPGDIATEVMNSAGGALPPSPWTFIDEATLEAFAAMDASNQPGAAKRRKMGK